jgi:hypothetical protein
MSQQPQKKGVSWVLMGLILVAVIVALGYDPIGDWLGQKNGMLLVSAVLIVAIIFSPAIDRFLKKHRP